TAFDANDTRAETSATSTRVTAQPADTSPPRTTITSGPSGTIASASASFSFNSSEAGSSFECRLDGGSWAGCPSPKPYSGLADGVHSFEVRATDGSGNTDTTPASRSFTVDTSTLGSDRPQSTVTFGPTGRIDPTCPSC